LTSVTAIIALTLGRFFGWSILDPIMGIVGSLVITRWAVGLLKETSGILLDGSVEPDLLDRIRVAVEAQDGCTVSDLHVWAVAPGRHAVILAVATHSPHTAEEIKALLSDIPNLIHINVEVHSE
ncbi:MAG TPA: hypothetical protein VIR77_04615, partial [Pontiella sp.]